MNRDEVIDVLSAVVAADRRTVGKADVDVWQAVIGDLPFDTAVNAVRDHLRECPDVWLQPGHIYARVKAKRRDETTAGPARTSATSPWKHATASGSASSSRPWVSPCVSSSVRVWDPDQRTQRWPSGAHGCPAARRLATRASTTTASPSRAARSTPHEPRL
ncbi:hypothetical protein [Mycobacteroides chelonae]|uniref:hypothetical protein n=1 Tax=Mycobacteroides chelonae TaxID=1774 RepID=UPI0009930C61|nr:hypothetical protein [Mycobacteroides chelonae]